MQLSDSDDLWQILVVLTKRTAIAQRRRERASKRGGGRVRGESVFAGRDGAAPRFDMGLVQSPSPEPTPALAAELNSELRQPLEKLGEETLRRIVVGKLEGFTNRELAQSPGISLRAVERKLSIIRSKWQREAGDESA